MNEAARAEIWEDEESEYTKEQAKSLFLLSAHFGQGSKPLHGSALINVFLEYPSLMPLMQEIVDSSKLAQGEDVWRTTPIAEEMIRKNDAYRMSNRHSKPKKEAGTESEEEKKTQLESARVATRDAFEILSEALEKTPRYASAPNANPIEAFARLTAARDEELFERSQDPKRPDLAALRRRVGYSFLCWYGLSQDREAHLADPKVPQFEEFKHIWRKAGDYVRENYRKLGPQTRAQFEQVIGRYEEATGEHLSLPT